MTSRHARAFLAALVAGVAVLASVSSVGETALAHASDCHAQQTCPSDDHSYVWYDTVGQGWDCALTDTSGAVPEGGGTVLSYDGVSYTCNPVTPPPTTPAETGPTEATGGTETAPRPPAPVEPRAETKREPRPRVSRRPRGGAVQAAGQAPVRGFPGNVRVKLTAGGYVFPVYGPASFVDTYGAARATTGWHHGIDIFGPLGAPILAVADGTVFSVGWNDVGGNRFWLRDAQGNQFYYAHLSAFTPLAQNGARVRAGTVLGFMGDTGDAAGTPYHLHFEIHPVSKLHLGYDGVINPMPLLTAWQKLEDVRLTPEDAQFAAAAGWALPVGASSAPRPGAVLLQGSDISTASGLEQGSLRRALATRAPMREEAWPVERDGTLAANAPRPNRPNAPALIDEVGGTPESWMQDVLAFDSPLVWDLVAQCEAGADWSADTGNGYSGGLQFHPGTWARYGGLAYADGAHGATREQQITVAERVLASEGWEAWPACSAKLGLR